MCLQAAVFGHVTWSRDPYLKGPDRPTLLEVSLVKCRGTLSSTSHIRSSDSFTEAVKSTLHWVLLPNKANCSSERDAPESLMTGEPKRLSVKREILSYRGGQN